MSSSQQVLRRRNDAGHGAAVLSEVLRNPGTPAPITAPPSTVDALKEHGNTYHFDSFSVVDALELGHLLHARLHPIADTQPTLISIALANTQQVIFQTGTGRGVMPDNERWVARKRNSVLRWGVSSYFLSLKYSGDEAAFAAKFAMSPEQASTYAIHGGGVPIRVAGVEGVVAVVVVSGLKQTEDHGVIMDVIAENWEAVN
ncbi:hypothetical protein D7B24_002546 [Verticillium nonalfalfae]|uniref:DUF967 domain protein n=1 Tax=Verticillium nonalfalfae TaxID=1051616 RepID=A0A3M9Y1K0_9PEZI|nr:uncharacterized protein D7B24_002546 [Verticillium nonalfalfae]RNJ53010.1 hypothetical protein D7B24_002546 [Verticillium nonalfalfae]